MTSRPAVLIPGYADVNDAAARLGFTTSAIRHHLRAYGDLSRLERYAAALADPLGIELPDDARASTPAEAAQLLGLNHTTVYTHLCKYGHLRGAGFLQRGRVAADGDRPISLAEVPGLEPYLGRARPETAPRGSLMVSAGALDVEAVIATIRQCRDEVLAEREGAA